jgi:hypothetical protein
VFLPHGTPLVRRGTAAKQIEAKSAAPALIASAAMAIGRTFPAATSWPRAHFTLKLIRNGPELKMVSIAIGFD